MDILEDNIHQDIIHLELILLGLILLDSILLVHIHQDSIHLQHTLLASTLQEHVNQASTHQVLILLLGHILQDMLNLVHILQDNVQDSIRQDNIRHQVTRQGSNLTHHLEVIISKLLDEEQTAHIIVSPCTILMAWMYLMYFMLRATSIVYNWAPVIPVIGLASDNINILDACSQ